MKGKRLVIEAAGQLPLDPEEAEAIGEIVADALNSEGYNGLVELIEEDMEER